MNQFLYRSIHRLHQPLRNQYIKTLQTPLWAPQYDIPLTEDRQLAYDRLQSLTDNDLISVKWFENDATKIFAAHEMVGMVDGATATKMTVQFNLFGGTYLKLKQTPDPDILDGIDSLRTMGCFALTELGFGNNAVEMETTAHWQDGAFVLHSPTPLSQKYWITNSYLHATYAVVFAQTHVDGTNEGVHGFLVRIRNDDGSPVDGVTILDQGHKIGMNGIDNGRLLFDQVRVGKNALLDKHSSMEDGIFASSIPKKRNRFLLLADQLISGRICIASMSIASTRMCLVAALQYMLTRHGVGPDGTSSTPLADYGLQQHAMLPLVARTFVLSYALQTIQERYEQGDDVLEEACIIKPLITWHAERTASICRERCGGQGFLSCNRFGEAIVAAHAGITAEGDNSILVQKVAKERLEGMDFKQVAWQTILGPWYRNQSHLHFRERQSRIQLVRALDHNDLFASWHDSSLEVQRCGIAFGERLVLDLAREAFEKNEGWEEWNRAYRVMESLYVADCVEKDMGWFAQHRSISYSTIMDEKKEYCRALHRVLPSLMEGLGVPSSLQFAPIANDWVEYNQRDHHGEVR